MKYSSCRECTVKMLDTSLSKSHFSMVGLESNIKELFSNMKYGPKFVYVLADGLWKYKQWIFNC